MNFEPSGSKFKLVSVQCASCGAVVGVMDFTNIGVELGTLRKQMKQLSEEVGRVEGYVLGLPAAIQRRS
ncbi:hypothetical protein [Anaeromyxobacter dehalogenans]|uniref:hypothetical protein n=1 Tax=Anaeromyxobacter dehalogenans TaxID=161493 RepID=UPI0012377FB0|nr:hypothetical protein [Anaeromyxobacter dehalogenans]